MLHDALSALHGISFFSLGAEMWLSFIFGGEELVTRGVLWQPCRAPAIGGHLSWLCPAIPAGHAHTGEETRRWASQQAEARSNHNYTEIGCQMLQTPSVIQMWQASTFHAEWRPVAPAHKQPNPGSVHTRLCPARAAQWQNQTNRGTAAPCRGENPRGEEATRPQRNAGTLCRAPSLVCRGN